MENRKQNGIVLIMARSRVYVSRLFAILILTLAVVTGHSFGQDNPLDVLFEMTGLFLLTICSMGRLWALLYISGNKSNELITDGPYSVVRHPLYLFSLIGAIGIGLVSENLLILALIVVFYVMYYPFTILAEEKKLEGAFGEAYIEYKCKTPRFFPKLSLYKSPDLYTVKADTFVRNFAGGMWFIWIYILFHIIEMIQDMGYVPVYWRIP